MRKLSVLLISLSATILLTACGGPKEVENYSLAVQVRGQTLNGLYTGTIIDKAPNGNGVFTFSDDTSTIIYSGTWENGVIPEDATLKYTGMTLKYEGSDYVGNYTGDAINGIPDGNGVFSSEDNDGHLVYDGSWRNGSFSEEGNLDCTNMSIDYNGVHYTGSYSGTVKDGIPCGTGKFTSSADGELLKYNGSWTDSKFSGEGEIETNNYIVNFIDGLKRVGTYTGDVRDGIASGNGRFTATNDQGIEYTYEGSWENGLYNGYGKVVWDSPEVYPQEGNFEQGEFHPTPLQYFQAQGKTKGEEYVINDHAVEFLNAHPDIFLSNSIDDSVPVDTDFKYEAFAKNQSNYGDKLISIPKLHVVQIFEENYWGDDHTFCIAEDSHYNVYSISMYGFADDIYEGSTVTLTALPLDFFTYPNTEGDRIWAIACAGVSLK